MIGWSEMNERLHDMMMNPKHDIFKCMAKDKMLTNVQQTSNFKFQIFHFLKLRIGQISIALN